MALTHRAHQLIQAHFENSAGKKALAIDATCGNGFDTEFLCGLGFDRVIGIDIQAQAIAITQHRLQQTEHQNFELLQCNHAQIDEVANQAIDCLLFNLGYLPHGDKTITTLAESSIAALSAGLNKLSQSGLVSLLCYPGHPQGAIETAEIQAFLASLPRKWKVTQYNSASPQPTAPVLYLITRANP